jgi:enediyne biosynthesis protein E4
MKFRKILHYLVFLPVVFILNEMKAQSFEKMNFTDLTTTLSGSRSANFVDVNGDGWDDIYITNGPPGGQNNMLYINNTDGTFTTVINGNIVSDGSSSDGASFADADNDGDLDLFVVTWAAGSAGKNFFYRNIGNGTFAYEAGIAMASDQTFSEMPVWIDFNNDQYLDLYYTNSNGSLGNRYYQNLQNGQFTNITNSTIINELKATRSVDWIDYDGDGDSDLFLTNENNDTNTLYRNDGYIIEDLAYRYVKITNLAIVQDSKNSSGSSWADIDNDGDFDLFVANWNNQNNQLFKNLNGNFTEQTTSVIASGGGSSFGSSFGDIDNDGDLDLYVCNAFNFFQTKNFVYINDGQGNFTQDTTSAIATQSGWTFGCAFGDYDNDGWLDLVLANTKNESQVNAVYHNTGSGNNWVKFNFTGTDSNTSAIGAKIRLKANINGNDVWQTRRIASSSGYCSQNSYSVHFGLGDAATVDELIVNWPSGLEENFTNIAINDIHDILEGVSLSVSDFNSEAKFKVYPNPVKDFLKINGDFSKIYSNITLRIVDLTGREVLLHSNFETTNFDRTKTIDVSILSTGVYIYTLSTLNSETIVSGKFIKE